MVLSVSTQVVIYALCSSVFIALAFPYWPLFALSFQALVIMSLILRERFVDVFVENVA